MAKSIILTACLFCLAALCSGNSRPDVIRARVQQVYTSQLGVVERTNHNDGKEVCKYLAYVGRTQGDAWCAAFVSWVFHTAGFQTMKSGRAANWYDHKGLIYQYGMQNPKQQPQAGDLVLYYDYRQGRICHIGFFDKYGDKYCETVEGNIHGPNGKQGVHRIKRYWKSFYAIIDKIDESHDN